MKHCFPPLVVIFKGDIRVHKLARTLVALLLLSCLASCASDPEIQTITPPPEKQSGDVFLSPGDELEIKFAYAPELNETQVIRSDNKIELALIGEIEAAGKTTSQFKSELEDAYSKHLAHPQVSIFVRTAYQNRVYVGGAVTEPGLIDMAGPMTALEAIMQAGGFDHSSAEVENVIVIRYEGKERNAYSLNFGESTDPENLFTPFYLEPRDIVFVPRTTIAKVDQWVEQHIWALLPNFGVTSRVGGN
nr:polysaccharide export protein [Deltaproteobacteria bacterium]